MIRKILNEYFNYTKQETRGIIVLVILITLVFIIPFFIKNNAQYHNNRTEYSDFAQKIETILSKQEEIPAEKKVKKQQQKVEYFQFDPNTVSKQDLKKMGFSDKQSKTLINYRKGGGVFKNKKDLKKIYGITDEMYIKLEPYIFIKQNKQEKTVAVYKKKPEPVYKMLTIEVNTADTSKFMQLKGIGAILSQRIINYRNFVGGFYKKEQLLEVYGIKSNVYNKIKDNLTVDTTVIKKININKVDFKTLAKHPYLTYTDTKRIFKFREISGDFTSISQLKTNKLVSIDTYNKIRHYLTIE